MTAPYSLLVVDDEPDLRTLYELTLIREGYDVDSAGTVEEAWARLGERQYSAVITDMKLPDGNGLDLLRRIEAQGRPEKTLVITAYGSAENAVEALKAGAFDYLTKPVDLRQFRSVVASALGRSLPAPGASSGAAGAAGAAPVPGAGAAAVAVLAALPANAASAASAVAEHPALRRLSGQSVVMQQVRALIERVARGMAPVLVQGESGTGKELVARAIHEVSSRAAMPFVAVNCGAIPEQLLEAEFFGYRKGAFTGATEDRVGFFQAAQGGTLFLDEIGDLPLAMQSKLLRAIQERSVRPIGAVAEAPVNVRIVSATHKDLAAEVPEGRFRQDLYYRLNVIQIRMPPLRERVDDLALIGSALLARISADAGVSPPPRLTTEATQLLSRHSFPGNVRELENLLHRAVTLTGGDLIQPQDLGLPLDDIGEAESAAAGAGPGAASGAVPTGPAPAETPTADDATRADALSLPSDLAAYLDQVERDILMRALEKYRFNRTAAGASLGLSLRQMRYRMARLGVQVAEQHGGD
ncbi:sigma-54-dependent transcriptional regulator [Aquabacterium sp. OR-4]|uniref:sigma-54-dependent transcriptional regulator n=1 Tax=Aquabacterium sp. OR-4 TaxID=2978127 RepID=UPI0028C6D825|nr:sigma-54 dependent transcriptional regulator [Aquabacterium sp. OR-4]MDT7837453.1 sigma-54 dependent transcriptional regulator [Aquabacterium sp. OR-4]